MDKHILKKSPSQPNGVFVFHKNDTLQITSIDRDRVNDEWNYKKSGAKSNLRLA